MKEGRMDTFWLWLSLVATVAGMIMAYARLHSEERVHRGFGIVWLAMGLWAAWRFTEAVI
jgi:hypothetical protein